jgi:hypothetical protein
VFVSQVRRGSFACKVSYAPSGLCLTKHLFCSLDTARHLSDRSAQVSTCELTARVQVEQREHGCFKEIPTDSKQWRNPGLGEVNVVKSLVLQMRSVECVEQRTKFHHVCGGRKLQICFTVQYSQEKADARKSPKAPVAEDLRPASSSTRVVGRG